MVRQPHYKKKNALYLVALPRGEVLQAALRLQHLVAEKYGVYKKPYPPLHMTVGVFFPADQHDLEKIKELLSSYFSKLKPFEISVNGSCCFAPPFKSLNLYVEKTETVLHLSREIFQLVSQKGLKAREMSDWDFHISLVNTVFASREWSMEEFHEACYLMEKEVISLSCNVERVELWSPVFPPLKVIATYILK